MLDIFRQMNDSQKQALLSYAQRIATLAMDDIAKIRHYQESTTPPNTWDEIGVMIAEDGWETLPLDIQKTDEIIFNLLDDDV
ncbi:MAG: hypothetical protein Q9P44_01685 [Anaerolineae bacterium]|nr:hypothetical protein [Anaerolineae bacterium]